MNGIFTHFFTTLFTHNSPIEYATRVIDLFWISDEKFLIDCVINLLRFKRESIKKMNMEVDNFYIGVICLSETVFGY